jgi:hypothetical protein
LGEEKPKVGFEWSNSVSVQQQWKLKIQLQLMGLFGKDMYRTEQNRVVGLLVLKLVKSDDVI